MHLSQQVHVVAKNVDLRTCFSIGFVIPRTRVPVYTMYIAIIIIPINLILKSILKKLTDALVSSDNNLI